MLDREPTHAPALAALGEVAFQQKDYNKALSILQQAIVGDGSVREAHYYLGLKFGRMGRKQESAEQTEIATRLEEHINRPDRQESAECADGG